MDKKALIKYPSLSTFLEFIDTTSLNVDYQLTSALERFFQTRESKISPKINPKDFNILVINTASKSISGSVKKLLSEYNEFVGPIRQDIKTWIIEHVYQIDVIGKLPQIESLLEPEFVNNKFDIILCQCELLTSVSHLKSYIKPNGLLITDKQYGININDVYGWNSIKLLDSFHTFESIPSSSIDPDYYINDSDITLNDFLDYNISDSPNLIGLDEYLRRFIQHVTINTKNNLSLSQYNFNILIICTSTPAIKREKYKTIIQRCMGADVHFSEDTEVYHLGKDVYNISSNNIFRGCVNNLILDIGYKGKVTKFDIIISDGCPAMMINTDINYLKNLLSFKGLLILPGEQKRIPNGFEIVTSISDGYISLMMI